MNFDFLASYQKGFWRTRLWIVEESFVSPVYSLEAIHSFEILHMLDFLAHAQ